MQNFVNECEQLLKQKENEITWNKINKLFIALITEIKTSENVSAHFHKFEKLLQRSLMSERSRLNGTCIDFLTKCVRLNAGYDFSEYISILFKLAGRSNKVFVTRAETCLLVLSKNIGVSTLCKHLEIYYGNPNKRVRETVLKVIEPKYSTNYHVLSQIVLKASSDPAVEVRTIVKRIKKQVVSPAVEEVKTSSKENKPVTSHKPKGEAKKTVEKPNYDFTQTKTYDFSASTSNLSKYIEKHQKSDDLDLRIKLNMIKKKSNLMKSLEGATESKVKFGTKSAATRAKSVVDEKMDECNNSIVEARAVVEKMLNNEDNSDKNVDLSDKTRSIDNTEELPEEKNLNLEQAFGNLSRQEQDPNISHISNKIESFTHTLIFDQENIVIGPSENDDSKINDITVSLRSIVLANGYHPADETFPLADKENSQNASHIIDQDNVCVDEIPLKPNESGITKVFCDEPDATFEIKEEKQHCSKKRPRIKKKRLNDLIAKGEHSKKSLKEGKRPVINSQQEIKRIDESICTSLNESAVWKDSTEEK